MNQVTIKCVIVYKYALCNICGSAIEYRDKSIFNKNIDFVCNTGWYAEENTPENKRAYKYIEKGLTIQTLLEKDLVSGKEYLRRDNHKYIYNKRCSDCNDEITVIVIHNDDYFHKRTTSYLSQYLDSYELTCPECTEHRTLPKPAKSN